MNKKYSIGLVAGYFKSPNMEHLINNISEILSLRYNVYLATGPYEVDTNHITEKICAIEQISVSSLYSLNDIPYSFIATYSLIKKHNVDIVINLTQPATLGVGVVMMSNFYHKASMIRMTGQIGEQNKIWKNDPWKRFKMWLLHDFIVRKVYSNATLITTLGLSLKKNLIDIDIDPSKIAVVQQPIEISKFKPILEGNKRLEIKLSLGLKVSRKIILYVGRISLQKGADILKDICSNVLSRNSSFQFCFVGGGDQVHLFDSFSKEDVILVGRVPHQEIDKYYKAADLLVFPSRTEGLPNTVLEALSCRLPVIASPVGCIPEYVKVTATDPHIYSEYIMSERWYLDPLPLWFEWNSQKNMYLNAVEDTLKLSKKRRYNAKSTLNR